MKRVLSISVTGFLLLFLAVGCTTATAPSRLDTFLCDDEIIVTEAGLEPPAASCVPIIKWPNGMNRGRQPAQCGPRIGDDDVRVVEIADMARVTDPLALFGTTSVGRAGGRLPMTVVGAADPVPLRYVVPVPSAQVKSAVLLAGLNAPGETVVIEREPDDDGEAQADGKHHSPHSALERKVCGLSSPPLSSTAAVTPPPTTCTCRGVNAALLPSALRRSCSRNTRIRFCAVLSLTRRATLAASLAYIAPSSAAACCQCFSSSNGAG